MIERFEKFSYCIFEISRCWHRLASEEMEKHGLKGPHATYLTIMYKFPEGITAPRLCELCGRDKSDVSRMISILEKKGLVLKEGAGKNLYRARLMLTDAGIKAALQVNERARTAVEKGSEGLNEEERNILYNSLDLIMKNLQNLCKEGLPEN